MRPAGGASAAHCLPLGPNLQRWDFGHQGSEVGQGQDSDLPRTLAPQPRAWPLLRGGLHAIKTSSTSINDNLCLELGCQPG